MNIDLPKLAINETFQLVKFDGDAPKPGEIKEPAEIIEGNNDGHRVVYRAGEGETKQLFIGNSDGYAELHSVTRR